MEPFGLYGTFSHLNLLICVGRDFKGPLSWILEGRDDGRTLYQGVINSSVKGLQ